MVIDNICKIIGRKAVALKQHLIVERIVRHGDITEGCIMEGCSALMRNPLSYDIRLTLCALKCLLKRQAAARAVLSLKLTAILLGLCLVAEAVIRMSAGYQHLGVLLIHITALSLDIRSYRASDIRSLVMLEPALLKRTVYNLSCALNLTRLIRILNTQYKYSVRIMLCYQIGIERGAQVADMHIACRRRCKSGAHLSVRNLSLRLLKKLIVCHIIISQIISIIKVNRAVPVLPGQGSLASLMRRIRVCFSIIYLFKSVRINSESQHYAYYGCK